MGGLGSGGHAAAGRKPKSASQKFLEGRGPKSAQVRVEEFDAPNDLTTAERLVWMRLAPHAFKAQTLNRATEYQFVMLCRNIVLERALAADPATVASPNHRGVIQRVERALLQFGLAPNGKPMVGEAPEVADPTAEFFEGSVQ